MFDETSAVSLMGNTDRTTQTLEFAVRFARGR
jgi:hypothetical protein